MQIDLKALQAHQLKMLKQLDKVLQQEGINYFAVHGTALGAVRHKGIIPWDDDIDLAMLRPDYEKFLTIQDKLPENLFVLNAGTNKNFPLLFSKVMDKNQEFQDKSLLRYDLPRKVFIDVFPWDNIDSSEPYEDLRKQVRRTVFKAYAGKLHKIKYCLNKIRYSFKSSSFYYEKLREKLILAQNKDTKIWMSVSEKGDRLAYEDIFPLKKVPFEDFYTYIPNQCEKYLLNKYGNNFMDIPPQEDRYNHSTLTKERL